MKIQKGLATWAGLVAAIGQYALAIATFMNTFSDVDPTAGVAPLVTATGVLYGVIKGRMDQATAAIHNPPAAAVAPVTYGAAGSGTVVTSTQSEPGDPDALPEYETTERPADDQGDEHARPEVAQ